jgi:2-polyprenyl-6-hydroxyphenyl methylase/3-demethylubiquinone-9 3-methyltransferase
MKRLLKLLIKTNQQTSIYFEKYFPQTKVFIIDTYNKITSSIINSKSNQLILDCGCGIKTTYSKFCDQTLKNKIIGFDLSIRAYENKDVDQVIIHDITKVSPFNVRSIDIITSSSMLEHLNEVESFIRHSSEILKKDGIFICLFANRFAPFAILNRLLPNKISKRLLYFFRSSMIDQGGQKGYYNKCTYYEIYRLLHKYNFVVTNSYFYYYQSFYFDFFFPLYFYSGIYELILKLLKNKILCSHMIITARKKE